MSRITINQLPEPVKRGQVHPKDYWNDEYFKQLEPLVAALKEEVPDAKYDGKALVFMLVQLLHFQEAALGKDAMPPRSAPKLPIKLVTDPSVGGALHAIALKLYDIRRARGLKAIEWQNPGKRNECKEVLMVLRRELERRALLQVPHIHISPTCGIEVQRLREYVRRLQGQLAERPDAPGVTHVVYPFGPKGDPDDGKEYTTVLAVKGVQARVHYWYMPDSYDAWIPLETVDNKEVVADRAPPGGVWKVTPRWIIDSEKYNEWMNPADYTTPEQDAEMDAAEAADPKGTKRAGSSLTGQAKKARGDGALEVAAEPLEVLGPTARLRQVLQPHRAMSDNSHTVENLSHGQINNHLSAYQPPLAPTVPPPPEVVAAAAAAAAGGGEQDQQQQQPAANGPSAAAAAAAAAGPAAAGRPPPGPPRISGMNFCVPSAAAWFKPNSVHNIEKAALPEWFNNRCPHKTLPLYRTYRDAMLSLYWEKPERDLTFAEVRQHLDGEVNGLMKIYEFLQNWGLINARDGLLQPQLPLGLGPGVSQRMPPGTAPLYQFKKPSRLEATSAAQAGGMYGQAAATAAGGDGGRLLNPVAGRKGAEEGLNPSCLTQIFCSAMPWVDCTRLRYHCTKFPDVNLCPQAFAEGRFPPGVSSKDFVRIDDSKRHNSSDHWTPEETMLLLEGVELYKEDWVKIASHVGKSQSACLTHFVRLPIEDPFIEDLTNWTEVAQRQQQQQQPWPPLPFQDEPNPLMSTLGVLAVILGPKVSSTAAQTALQVLAEQDLTAGAVLNPETRLAAVKAAAKQGAANGHSAGGSDAQQEQQQEAGDGVNGDGVMQGLAEGSSQPDGPSGSKQQQDEAAAAAAAAVDPQRPIDKRLLMSAVAAGLAAAATRAKQLAFAEEREIQRCMVGLVDVAAKKVDAKVTLLQQLNDPPGLDRERGQVEGTHKPLRLEKQNVQAQLTQRLAMKKQQDEAAAAAKQKVEALKKQQAEAAAAARQKAAAAAAAAAAPASPAVQAGQQAAAKPPGGGSSGQQQQQQPPAGTPATPTAATAAAAAAAAGMVSQQQQSQQMSQDLQPSQQQEQTPGKSTVSSGAGGDSEVLDDEDDLGELLDDVADGDMELDGLDDEEMDMP